MQRPVSGVAFDEGRVRHAWIIEQEGAPHEPHEVYRTLRPVGKKVSLQFETADKRGNRIASLGQNR